MVSGNKTRTIRCPVQNRLVDVTYRAVGKWYKREYDVHSCPAMRDWGGCDRQCKHQIEISPKSIEWQSRY